MAWRSLPVGRAQEARQEAERALESDPLSQILHWCLAIALEEMGLEKEARAVHGKAVELDPQFWLGWWQFGMHHAIHGRYDEARDCAEKAFAIFPSSYNNIGLLAGVLRSAGETGRGEALLADLPTSSAGPLVALACCHLVCSDIEAAVDWATKVVGSRNPLFISAFRPFENILRKARGWSALLKKLNLPEGGLTE
jgi:tetratricopeptide (TPR) repeat protein